MLGGLVGLGGSEHGGVAELAHLLLPVAGEGAAQALHPVILQQVEHVHEGRVVPEEVPAEPARRFAVRLDEEDAIQADEVVQLSRGDVAVVLRQEGQVGGVETTKVKLRPSEKVRQTSILSFSGFTPSQGVGKKRVYSMAHYHPVFLYAEACLMADSGFINPNIDPDRGHILHNGIGLAGFDHLKEIPLYLGIPFGIEQQRGG